MPSKTSRIRFHFQHGPFSLPDRSRLKHFLLSLFKREGYEVEAVNYIFCTDAYLLGLNKSYLNHDTYTDIVTFGLSRPDEPVLAEVYISVQRVRENAATYEASFSQELHRVIFHGALHLAGYKDKTSRDQQIMRSKEDEYLERYFVPRETKRSKS